MPVVKDKYIVTGTIFGTRTDKVSDPYLLIPFSISGNRIMVSFFPG